MGKTRTTPSLYTMTPRQLLQLSNGEPLFIAHHFDLSDEVADELLKAATAAISIPRLMTASQFLRRYNQNSIENPSPYPSFSPSQDKYHKMTSSAEHPHSSAITTSHNSCSQVKNSKELQSTSHNTRCGAVGSTSLCCSHSNDPLTELLKGKIPSGLNGGILEIVGEAGSGKSHLCYTVAAYTLVEGCCADSSNKNNNIISDRVIWIDSEHKFNPFRLRAAVQHQWERRRQRIKEEGLTEDVREEVLNGHTTDDALRRLDVYSVVTIKDLLELLQSFLAPPPLPTRRGSRMTGTDGDNRRSNAQQQMELNEGASCVVIIDSVAAASRNQRAFDDLGVWGYFEGREDAGEEDGGEQLGGDAANKGCEAVEIEASGDAQEQKRAAGNGRGEQIEGRRKRKLAECRGLDGLDNDGHTENGSDGDEEMVKSETGQEESLNASESFMQSLERQSKRSFKPALLELSSLLKKLAGGIEDEETNNVTSGWKRAIDKAISFNASESGSTEDGLAGAPSHLRKQRCVVVVNQITTVIDPPHAHDNPLGLTPDMHAKQEDGESIDKSDYDTNDAALNHCSTYTPNDDKEDPQGQEQLIHSSRSADLLGYDYVECQSFIGSSRSSLLQPALGVDWNHAINHRVLLRFSAKDDCSSSSAVGNCCRREIVFEKSSVYSDNDVKEFDVIDGGFISFG